MSDQQRRAEDRRLDEILENSKHLDRCMDELRKEFSKDQVQHGRFEERVMQAEQEIKKHSDQLDSNNRWISEATGRVAIIAAGIGTLGSLVGGVIDHVFFRK